MDESSDRGGRGRPSLGRHHRLRFRPVSVTGPPPRRWQRYEIQIIAVGRTLNKKKKETKGAWKGASDRGKSLGCRR